MDGSNEARFVSHDSLKLTISIELSLCAQLGDVECDKELAI